MFLSCHPHANPQAPAKAAEPSTSCKHVPVVTPQQALQAEAAVASAFGLPEFHLRQCHHLSSLHKLIHQTLESFEQIVSSVCTININLPFGLYIVLWLCPYIRENVCRLRVPLCRLRGFTVKPRCTSDLGKAGCRRSGQGFVFFTH